MPELTATGPYVLGLDIGAASIGWACVRLRQNIPSGIIVSGVRLFNAGMSGSFERGQEQSRAVERRTARLARRQFRRRASRRWVVFQLLHKSGLLPPGDIKGRSDLPNYIAALDKSLAQEFCPVPKVRAERTRNDHVSTQLLVYRIRAAAVQRRVDPFALGRAILHLAKRRGFNSNLRGAPKDDEETGKVKPAINSLANDLAATNSTLGQHLATLDPFARRIRQRWTGREMYKQEFERIWETQRAFHPQLTDDLRKKLLRAIFFQRPLRSAKGLVGKCSLEPKKRRLAAAHPLAQEVRMLQFVNNVRVRKRGEVERPLSEHERGLALAALQNCGRMKLADFRTAIELPKNVKLNFDGDDDSHARGMGTVSEIKAIICDCWDKLSEEEQEKLFYELLSYTKRDALVRRLKTYWRFSDQQAELLADVELEPGYARHCKAALTRLRDVLSTQDAATARWPTYAEAKLAAYPDCHTSDAPIDRLPPVLGNVANVTSPAVIRALTEVRKVVNELLQRFGKPEFIRIELARDLKRSKKERKNAEELMKDRAKERRKALAEIRKEFTGYPDRRGFDRGIEKYMLAEECNWTCPYTGETVHSVRDLIGDNSRFDVEHIFPRRYLDDSFANKTLCLHEENRHVKRDRLPAEAYSDQPERFKEILTRVKKFKGPLAAKKLARFMATEVPSDFTARQLNETRYTTVAAADYLGLLYGGRADASGRQRIFTLTGGLTKALRGQWRLNQILGSDEKNRADHRQHAIDAIIAACTDPRTVQLLSSAAAAEWQRGGSRGLPEIEPAWPGLLDEARHSVLDIIVSHRQDRRLNGPLHADSNYTPPNEQNGQRRSKVRKPLASLSESEIASDDAIVDPRIRHLIQAQFKKLRAELGASKKAKEVFASPEHHPAITNRDGSQTPIHSARVWVKAQSFAIRKGDPTRFVAATQGSNFCTQILSVLDANGREIAWTDRPISRLDALRNRNEPKADPLLRFPLFANEFVVMPDREGEWQIYRVLNVSKGNIELRLHHDAKTRDEIRKEGLRTEIRSGALTERRFQKVNLSPTGVLTDALSGAPLDLKTLEKPSPRKQTRKKPKDKDR